MIKTLYKRAESTVMNGGETTGYFPLERAARQGDPISPTLFVLALEPLLQVLKEEVKGIQTPKGRFKVSAYADDVTVGLGDVDDVNAIIKILNKFGKFSGLKINLEKCEILSLNGKTTQNTEIKQTSYIKITGIVFGEKKNMCNIEKKNFEPALCAIRNKLNLWKMRALTLIGSFANYRLSKRRNGRLVWICFLLPDLRSTGSKTLKNVTRQIIPAGGSSLLEQRSRA